MTDHPLILVVEDEPEVRELIVEILKAEHFEVREAGNGQEALNLLKGGLKPTLIFCDIQMPVMKGTDFLRHAIHNDATTPVCMLTAYSDQEYIVEALQLGAIDYVVKPFQVDDLVKKAYLLLEIGKARRAGDDSVEKRHREALLRIKNSQ